MRPLNAPAWGSLDQLPPALRPAESAARAKVEETARDFASFFLAQVMRQQRETIEQSDLFHGGRGEEVFTGLLDTESSREMAGRDHGITALVREGLAGRMQGWATPDARLAAAQQHAAKAYGSRP
ncbi:MAG: rod-binding protein [Planctomycetes bacterium]|nr:rod-binding protein [Planctomycetota bacterium]